MAIYHLTAKVISRGKGQSVVAAAAYRSGERLTDERDGTVKEYKARNERILFEGIFAPADAPEWARSRNSLWNAVEERESRGQGVNPAKAQLARELEIALPHELSYAQREWLIKDFVREQFVRKGYAVDLAIHAPDKDSDARNFHAHLLIPLRSIGPEGFADRKDRSQNAPEQLVEWRQEWAHLANRHLERHGHEARIDHRSLGAQGIDREPTQHVGYAADAMAARGEEANRAAENEAIKAGNKVREIVLPDAPNLYESLGSGPESAAAKLAQTLRDVQRDAQQDLKARHQAAQDELKGFHQLEREEFLKQLAEDKAAHYERGQLGRNSAAAKAFADTSQEYRDEWKKLFRETPPELLPEAKEALRAQFKASLHDKREELFGLVGDAREAAWGVTYRSCTKDFYEEQKQERFTLRMELQRERDELSDKHFFQWQDFNEARRDQRAQESYHDLLQSLALSPNHAGMASVQMKAVRYLAGQAERQHADFERIADAAHAGRVDNDRIADLAVRFDHVREEALGLSDAEMQRQHERREREEASKAARDTDKVESAKGEMTESRLRSQGSEKNAERTARVEARMKWMKERAAGRGNLDRDLDGRERD